MAGPSVTAERCMELIASRLAGRALGLGLDPVFGDELNAAADADDVYAFSQAQDLLGEWAEVCSICSSLVLE